MARVTVSGNTQAFPDDTRLVRAIQALGIEIGHRCGGKARCTTCRVEFVRGEPEEMTQAEYDKLSEKGLLGKVRLSCQILCREDMEVRPLMTKASEGWPDTGPEPAETIEPEPVWHKKQALLGSV
jgi:ferredoxin